MIKSEDIALDSTHLQCLVIGEPSTGKTYFAKSWPTPAWVFDFDRAFNAYRNKSGFEIETYAPVAGDWIQFEKDVARVVKDEKYKTIILDSTTSMRRCAMARAMEMNPQRSPVGGAIGISDKSHYGIAKNLIENQINRLIACGKNLVVIAHVQVDRDEDTKMLTASPVLIGQHRTEIPALFTEVYYTVLKKDTQKYYLQTFNDGLFSGKSVISGTGNPLPERIPNDYPTLMGYLKGEIKPLT